MDHLCYFCRVFVMLLSTSVSCCLVVTCWERAALLALVSHWYPGSGVVLDCIDSRTLHSFLHSSFIVEKSLFSREKRPPLNLSSVFCSFSKNKSPY